ncbi:hypothetical protein IKF27_01615, partial [Candidatus Saccharibacteria bacterium]|nr:hypothetical protein [Candidatus Saccharibacteria bacterium]
TNGPVSGSGKETYSSHSYYSYGAAQIVCPKGWRLPTKVEYDNIVTFMRAGGNTTAGSTKIRGTPYNFLYGGLFNSSGFNSNVGTTGRYWSSVQYNATNGYHLNFTSSALATGYVAKNTGQSVRCVSQPLPQGATGWMQYFDTSVLADGESTTLADIRDGNSYTVKKFGSGADAEVWMTSNLTLGYDQANDTPKGHALTNIYTNIPASDTTIYYFPPAGKRGAVTSSGTMTSTANATFNASNPSQAHVQYAAASATGSTNPQPTGYYNYPAATLGFSYYNDSISSGSSTKDICPKGWQLPEGSSTATYSFYWLDKTLGGTGANRTDATTRDHYVNDFALSYSGLYDNSSLYSVGSHGNWWSSTVNDSYSSYFLDVGSSGGVLPQNRANKYYGYAVRCVAQ